MRFQPYQILWEIQRPHRKENTWCTHVMSDYRWQQCPSKWIWLIPWNQFNFDFRAPVKMLEMKNKNRSKRYLLYAMFESIFVDLVFHLIPTKTSGLRHPQAGARNKNIMSNLLVNVSVPTRGLLYVSFTRWCCILHNPRLVSREMIQFWLLQRERQPGNPWHKPSGCCSSFWFLSFSGFVPSTASRILTTVTMPYSFTVLS